jgi:hypothetical protein
MKASAKVTKMPKQDDAPKKKERKTKTPKSKESFNGGWGGDGLRKVLQETMRPVADEPVIEQPKKSAPKPNPMFEYLSNNLRLELDEGGFTDPNNRRVKLMLCDKEISSVSFDVVQKREYEG